MPYVHGADLVTDVLSRAGEIQGSSEWDSKVLDYLNRGYVALCTGSCEFLPETVEDWWWMRANGTLILDPVINAGTVSVTQGSATATFSSAPGAVTGYRFKIDNAPEVYIVSSIAGAVATLDTIYVGDTNAAASYDLMHTVYSLSASVSAILSPIVSFLDNPQLFGTSPERMDYLFPLQRLQTGIPKAFCLETETSIRFSHGGKTDGKSMRVEYRYRPTVTDLANVSTSIPLLPVQYRYLLADMALVQVFSDKNDDRVASVGAQARAGLMAMVRENHRRLTKVDQFSGQLVTRQGQARHNENKLLRTETGLIIG